jgi:hypothetical protein
MNGFSVLNALDGICITLFGALGSRMRVVLSGVRKSTVPTLTWLIFSGTNFLSFCAVSIGTGLGNGGLRVGNAEIG